jgi:guanosine-3',5'-bis(diphosphate) 3'-pyrophosphohydrolase
MNNVLQKIRDYADAAHGTQTRKYTPERYIVHPVRVMETCAQYTDKQPILAAALMHDVLEDTPVTQQEMHAFLQTLMNEADAAETLKLVIELTDVYVKKDYPKMNRRTRKAKEQIRIADTSADSQTIKYADIIDNCNEIVKHDPDFAKVFLYECRANLRVMGKGNADLYNRAVQKVDDAIASMKK